MRVKGIELNTDSLPCAKTEKQVDDPGQKSKFYTQRTEATRGAKKVGEEHTGVMEDGWEKRRPTKQGRDDDDVHIERPMASR